MRYTACVAESVERFALPSHNNCMYVCTAAYSHLQRASCSTTGLCERSDKGITIKLSAPGLSARTRKHELRVALLHEMIHAWVFKNRYDLHDETKDALGEGGHGGLFREYKAWIEASTEPDRYRPQGGYRIPDTHDMQLPQQHAWKCGRCATVLVCS